MSQTAQEIRQSIRQKLDGQLSGPALVRRLAEYDSWRVPNRFIHLNGETTALLFSDESTYRFAQERFGRESIPDDSIALPGSVIFEKIAGSVDNFSIDPCSPETISFPKPFLPKLKEWGESVNVERALNTILETGKSWNVIKNFSRYMIAVKEQENGPPLPLGAPDTKGRALLAVFTSDDNFNQFVQDQHGGVAQAGSIFTGARFFDWVRTFQCDGFVFNCCGPARPAAFVKAFADDVLTKG